jgi:VIT1/CCC1 family predicted Fe2+/Mn2+ transporter
MTRRLHISESKYNYLADSVLGSIDGCVTNFAVVAGVTGANFPAIIAVVLGLANLFGDGVSMAVSNYEATRSRQSFPKDKHSPLVAGFITFLAFLVSGSLPLLPYILGLEPHTTFYMSAVIAALVFFSIGSLKGVVLGKPFLISGFSTLLTGGSAAALAFIIGYYTQSLLGVNVDLL